MSTSSLLPSSPVPRHALAWSMTDESWAMSYVVAQYALLDMSVTMMLALHMCISGILLLLFVIAGRCSLHLIGHDISQLALLALIDFIVNKLFEFGDVSFWRVALT